MTETAQMETAALVVFAVSTGVVFYVLLGYPALLTLLLKLRGPKPVGRAPVEPTVTLILPVRDGVRWIGQKLQSILALDYPRERLQILVIDDGSKDGTADVVADYASAGVELIRIPPSGKATAINAGLTRARGEVLFFTDVRQGLDAHSLRRLVESLADPAVGVVSGELVILKGGSQEEADIGLYWRIEKWIRKRMSALGSVPGATGCIYAMRRELAQPLPADMLVDDMYLPLAAHLKGGRIVFSEAARAYDYPTSLDSEFRRKVRTLAGNYQIVRALPRLLLPTTPVWLHFVSHKLGRLLLPFAFIAIAATTPFLSAPLRAWALAAQAGAYGMALLDPVLPPASFVKRLSSPARTFVVLMAAALVAPTVFFIGARRFWTRTRVSELPRDSG